MDDPRCCQFFLQPKQTFHRRYEALRACVVDDQPLAEVADRFGYRPSSLKSMLCRFRAACRHGGPPPFSLRTDAADLRGDDAAKIKTAPSHRRSPMSDD
jgi:hypothetical protein